MRLEELTFRPSTYRLPIGPCNCCGCRFGHDHPCVLDIGRYPVMVWLTLGKRYEREVT